MKSDLSVLVVDDNVTRRHWILNVILGELPYTVVSVPSAYQALRWLKKLRPSAIVMGEELRRKDFQRFQAVMRKRYPDVRLLVASCPWLIGTNLMSMSPGGYHSLVLCTQNYGAGLRAAVQKAIGNRVCGLGTCNEVAGKAHAT